MFAKALRIALPFIILLAVLLMEFGFTNLYWNIPETYDLYQRIKKSDAAATFGPEYDLLVLGDSTGEYGVIPTLLREKTGLTSYNYATRNYVSSVADVYLLEEYLNTHPKPQGIVVVRSIVGLGHQTSDILIREFFQRADVAWFLYWNGHTGIEQLVTGAVASLIPSVNRQYHLKRLVVDQKQIITPTMLFRRPSFIPDEATLGYSSDTRVQSLSDLQESMRVGHERAAKGVYMPLQENLDLLLHLCRIANRQGITAVFVSSPYLEDMKTDTVFMDAIHSASLQAQEALSVTPGCRWYGPEPMSRAALSDLVHPNHTGAILFTNQIAEIFHEQMN